MKKFAKFMFALVLSASTTMAYGWEEGNCCCNEGEALRSDTSFNGFYIGVNGTWAVPSETGLGLFSDSWQYDNGGGQTLAKSKPSHQHYKGAGGFKLANHFKKTP